MDDDDVVRLPVLPTARSCPSIEPMAVRRRCFEHKAGFSEMAIGLGISVDRLFDILMPHGRTSK